MATKITDEQAYEAVKEHLHFEDAAKKIGCSLGSLIAKYWRHIARTDAPEINISRKWYGSKDGRLIHVRATHGEFTKLSLLTLTQRWPDAKKGDRVRVEWEAKDDEGRDTMLLTRLREGDDD